MRIACCHCGPRGHEEYSYYGDATVARPGWVSALAEEAAGAPVQETWHDYVYLRENPSGRHRELWQHTGGCRAWLVVTRDTRTHEVLAVESARAIALAARGAQ